MSLKDIHINFNIISINFVLINYKTHIENNINFDYISLSAHIVYD